jgi:hypothetical protein
MKWIDRIKADYAKVKDQPRKEKLEFFWEYYKIPIVCVLLAVVLVVQGIFSLANQRDTVYSAVMLNCRLGADEKDFLSDFYKYAGIDEETKQAAIYTDMTIVEGRYRDNANTLQRIMAGISIRDTDFIAAPADAFHHCAYNTGNMLIDLRKFLSEEELTRYADRLYYIDGKVLELLNAPLGEHVEPELIKYPDPLKPELMDDPIPVGINVTDRKVFMDTYYWADILADTPVYLGFVPNSQRMELNHKLLDYLFLPTADEKK